MASDCLISCVQFVCCVCCLLSAAPYFTQQPWEYLKEASESDGGVLRSVLAMEPSMSNAFLVASVPVNKLPVVLKAKVGGNNQSIMYVVLIIQCT